MNPLQFCSHNSSVITNVMTTSATVRTTLFYTIEAWGPLNSKIWGGRNPKKVRVIITKLNKFVFSPKSGGGPPAPSAPDPMHWRYPYYVCCYFLTASPSQSHTISNDAYALRKSTTTSKSQPRHMEPVGRGRKSREPKWRTHIMFLWFERTFSRSRGLLISHRCTNNIHNKSK